DPVKLNFVSGTVNGYFDNSIHTAGDWNRLINAAAFRHFDLKGQYATMTFETSAYRSYVPDGKTLIDLYDLLVYDEQDFIGLVKYNKMFHNRAHFQVVYGDAFMYANDYHTGYNASTQAEILNANKLTANGMSYSESVWGLAHELGHVHQTRPGMKWVGMAEVTNNIHSAYIQTKWTGKCRLQEENLGGGKNRYQKAFTEILDANISYMQHDDPFCKLIPFWQLKLYMVDALGKTDFYKDIYEWVRTSPDLDNGACQIQFVEFACKSANLDLTAFFTAWGFLTPLNLTIDDYGEGVHTVTQQMINDAKARIAAENYPKPAHDFTRITDNNKLSYQN
ncbi:MAG: M60 family metallopeptidase, partial [Prevotellaceae bacterium]|nr:M60 family metallopeptidase [Prevotellaceae bacterium]